MEYTRGLKQLQEEVNNVIKGKQQIVEKVLAALIAGGHILMEDIPGVGKTTLATTFAKALSMEYKRVQFTPDVLPSDILGFSMYNNQTKSFIFHEGAVFCNLFLADEINRTSPKTQSALLEVMEEGNATVDGVTRKLPQPFLVIATQNPYGSSGTQMLPESQLDRFMIRISMGYPSHEDSVAILKHNHLDLVNKVQQVLSIQELVVLRQQMDQLYVRDEIYEYITYLVEETRRSPLFSMGASPRGAIALLKMSKAMAVIHGRDFVTVQDIQKVLVDVLGHRVVLSAHGKSQGTSMEEAFEILCRSVRLPRN